MLLDRILKGKGKIRYPVNKWTLLWSISEVATLISQCRGQ